jgi:Domain of unknown function (DUF4258)
MEYKGLIFTNHIIDRMNQRNISFAEVAWVFQNPEKILPASTKGAYKYYRDNDKKKLAIVAKKNEQGKWLILTCWKKEVFDYQSKKKDGKKLNFWQNLWKMVLER